MKTHFQLFFEFKIYRIKIALVHAGADAGIRYFSVNGIPTSKPQYRYWLLNIGYRFGFCGISIRE